jgi:hypothetical protein
VRAHFERLDEAAATQHRRRGQRRSQVDEYRILERACDKFLQCAYLALRISDANKLAPRHLDYANHVVRLKAGKTQLPCVIPFLDDDVFRPVALIEKYRPLGLDTCLPVGTGLDDYLPTVAQLAGLTRIALTSKVGRKTFVTLKLAQGVPRTTVMQATAPKVDSTSTWALTKRSWSKPTAKRPGRWPKEDPLNPMQRLRPKHTLSCRRVHSTPSMKKLSLLLGLALLTSCHKETEAPTGLIGEWHLQTYDFSSYSAAGDLLSHTVSPGGDAQNIIITDSTVAFYSEYTNSPSPPSAPQWVARKYARVGDTLRYDQWRYDVIVTLTSTALTLHSSTKQATPSYYQESDSYYTRVR